MNKKFKTISAVLLAAAMCASFAGCSKKGDNGVYVDKNGNVSVNESKFENHINSVFCGGENNSKPTSSAPKEEKFAATDEIKNAALNSGSVQLNNDIFQRGGYITVADFVEKYKDKYDFIYNCPKDGWIQEAGSYDECKEYLVEYKDRFQEIYSSFGLRWSERSNGGIGVFAGCEYYLTLTPKSANTANKINAYVVNATSPDKKITLDQAIVAEVAPAEGEHYALNAPEWIPMGLNDNDFKDYESENKNYSISNIGEALEAKGLKKCSEKVSDYSLPSSREAENYNTYWVGKSSVGCYALGEKNLFGAKPFYYYSFRIDENTDKVNYVSCTLQGFVKE